MPPWHQVTHATATIILSGIISLCTMHCKLKRSKELKLKKGLSKCNSDGFRFKGGECKLGGTSDFSGWFQCNFCVPLERYQQISKYSWQRLDYGSLSFHYDKEVITLHLHNVTHNWVKTTFTCNCQLSSVSPLRCFSLIIWQMMQHRQFLSTST